MYGLFNICAFAIVEALYCICIVTNSYYVLQDLTSSKNIIHGSDLLHLDLTLYANWA